MLSLTHLFILCSIFNLSWCLLPVIGKRSTVVTYPYRFEGVCSITWYLVRDGLPSIGELIKPDRERIGRENVCERIYVLVLSLANKDQGGNILKRNLSESHLLQICLQLLLDIAYALKKENSVWKVIIWEQYYLVEI